MIERHRIEEPVRHRAPAVTAIVLLASGVLVDLMATRHPAGMGLALAATGAALALVALVRPVAPALVAIASAAAVSWFAVLRDSPWLLWLDVTAIAGLAVVGASFARGGRPWAESLRGYVNRFLGVPLAIPAGARLAVPPGIVGRDTRRSLGRVIRTVAMAGLGIAVFGVILGSADPVFARVISAPLRIRAPIGSLAGHAAVAAGVSIGLGILAAHGRDPRQVRLPAVRSGVGVRLSFRDRAALLLGVDVVFAIFVIVQFAYLFGGHGRVLVQEGLTYAEYARTGFAQLELSAVLVLLLIAGVWTRLGDRRAHLVLGALGAVLVLLTMVVLASALRRLLLYEEAYGFTRMRILVHAFILLTGAVLVCALVALVLRRTDWLTGAVLALALATLVGVNVVDLDRTVAERNLERFRTTGLIDVAYLASLSGDAVPTLVTALPELPSRERDALAFALACRPDVDRGSGWLSWNVAREAARRSLASLAVGCEGPGPPAVPS